ncbi:hypothetical protein FRB99_008449 [Tulasnella sp. 403]|nr:hypothetical protein FRB99_008449 [Tulasnella sp. 403]
MCLDHNDKLVPINLESAFFSLCVSVLAESQEQPLASAIPALQPLPRRAQRVLREARPVCDHPIKEVWDILGVRIYQYLDSQEIQWSSIDPVRFAEQGGDAGPLHLWIGVEPKTLSFELAKTAADHCKEILAEASFGDVEIASRESTVTRSAFRS